MKTTIAYGLRFENESLRQAAAIYLDGSLAFQTKKEALAHLKKIRKDGSVHEKEIVKVFKFIAEEL